MAAGKRGIDVPIGPAIVEYGEGAEMVTYEITKGGIVFKAETSIKDVTVDQFGETPVKSTTQGGNAEVEVPFALHDLERLAAAMPNSKLIKDSSDPTKMKLMVSGEAGYDMLSAAKKLVIKPTAPGTTPNDYITVPLAGAVSNPEYTYNSDDERIANLTFKAYPDTDNDGLLYIMGDESAE
ncbi:hypothetical protein [Bacillus sp. RK1064]|uniref:hypothetical protein n=1 Tax=Bacillus sp. RK1064 TaxID=3447561 RepID=UPI003ED9E81B